MITNDILYVGVDDRDIDLFEGQFVVPNGIAYNSYVILDDKIAVMDTVDKRKGTEYLLNLEKALGDRLPDYLIVSHVEPDHASSIRLFLDKYPKTQLVGNAKTFQFLAQYFDLNFDSVLTVREGDTLLLGKHELHFIFAPMVHWPEVMFTYDSCDKVLFSADAFGKFGALDANEDWTCEARRYYFNIVGKFGMPVQTVLKKAAALDIRIICPLHGPILSENLGKYLDKYNTWSSYEPESEGVFIACASLHGNTKDAAFALKEMLLSKGCPKVVISDLARDDMAEALEDAFRYGKIVLAASSYNGGVMPFMEDFLHHLKGKNYQKRTVALIENGTWAPSANKAMTEILSQMKDITILDTAITLRGTMKAEDKKALASLADRLCTS
ncbi:FprA family A-type flavoprotein [Parablautia intestinalis]|uniref:FprA family A-type flavoprotein n=1 Tax=Parablautia intestinalis TaxID=2320100 RepID=UPI00256EA3E9|nr:FprA family A-type flavoprotein [Parablautia intestinalis]